MFAAELGVYGGWVAHEGSFAARQPASATLGRPGGAAFRRRMLRARHAAPASRILGRYKAQGDAFVAGLNGLFTGLLIDHARRQALLFNDRYGSERLYVFEKNGALYFASEAKALLAVLPELRAFDDTGVAQFLAFGSTLGGHTLFRGLSSSLPGRFALGSRRARREADSLLRPGRVGSAAGADRMPKFESALRRHVLEPSAAALSSSRTGASGSRSPAGWTRA